MGYPNSVEEIDNGMLHEGIDMLDGFELAEYELQSEMRHFFNKNKERQSGDYGYWLDNCGDDIWYCQHCLQTECNKRMDKCHRGVIK